MSTKIEWTEKTWNPVTGCSFGCGYCYARRMARRLQAMGQPRYADGFKPTFHPEALEEPLHWRKPCRVFVCSMGDLFDPAITDEQIAEVWGVMAVAGQKFQGPGDGYTLGPRTVLWGKKTFRPHWPNQRHGPHTFQILTKQPGRMFQTLTSKRGHDFCYLAGAAAYRKAHDRVCAGGLSDSIERGSYWPLPNVWLGTSVEHPAHLNRVDELRQVPAAVRFISFEPLCASMGEIDLTDIHWVIVGADSTRNGNHMSLQWVCDIRDQCVAASVPFFFKQRIANGRKISMPELDGRVWDQYPEAPNA